MAKILVLILIFKKSPFSDTHLSQHHIYLCHKAKSQLFQKLYQWINLENILEKKNCTYSSTLRFTVKVKYYFLH